MQFGGFGANLLGLLPQVVPKRHLGQPRQRRLGGALAGPLKRPVRLRVHAQPHQHIAQIDLHLADHVGVQIIAFVSRRHQGLAHGLDRSWCIAPLQPEVGHVPMQLPQLTVAAHQHGPLVSHSSASPLAQLFQHARQRQKGFKTLRLACGCPVIRLRRFSHAGLTAQPVAQLQPA